MPRPTTRARARVLAGLYAALGIADSASVAKRFRAGECATKPLLMPVLAAFALAAAGDRREDMRLPAAARHRKTLTPLLPERPVATPPPSPSCRGAVDPVASVP